MVSGVRGDAPEAPGAVVAEGTLDAQGKARVEALRGGTYAACFPTLDQDAWEPV